MMPCRLLTGHHTQMSDHLSVYVFGYIAQPDNGGADWSTLVGFNISSIPLKDLILDSITSLRKKDSTRMFSSLFLQLV